MVAVLKRSSWQLIAIKANENVELVHYAQPLLNEADSLAKVMPSDIPLKQRRWLGLQMLEGDIYSRAYAGEASQHLDAALARLRNEMDDPALHIARCALPVHCCHL